jgi:hypothetical protein
MAVALRPEAVMLSICANRWIAVMVNETLNSEWKNNQPRINRSDASWQVLFFGRAEHSCMDINE